MRWPTGISRGLRKKQCDAAGRSRVKSFLPALECLEDRTLMDSAFMALATHVDDRLAALQTLLGTVVTTSAQLPVFNRQMGSIAGDAQQALQNVRGALKSNLGTLDSTKTDAVLEQELYNLLSPLKVLYDSNDNKDVRDEIDVTRDATRGLVITLNVGREVKAKGISTFGLSLPGVPFQLDGAGLDVKAGFVYKQLTFGVNPASHPFFDSSTATNEFQSTLSADLLPPSPNTLLGGSLGFLAVGVKPGGKNGLSASLRMDVQGNTVNTMALSNPKLYGSADVNLDITANFGTAV